MLKKLGKKITNNFGLKLLATMVAVILWIVVVNIDDPMKPQMYTTSVQPVNADYIIGKGKYYEWLDGKNTISFTATAERSIIEKLSASDFTATADMEKIEYDEESGSYRVPVTVAVSRYSSKVTISSKQLYMDVVLEDLGTVQKAIKANTKGSVADGCALGELQIVGSNVLKVSGPYSIVSQIDTAVATINVEGMSTDVADSVVPVLYDVDGNVIDTTKLKLSLSTVAVEAQILNTKDVALEFTTTGKVADGYMVTDIAHGLETVRIKGEAATLNKVNKIVIPKEVLDVTGAEKDITTTVDITSYLPSGTSLVLNSDGKIEVTVKIEPVVTKTFEVPVANLIVENLREGYEADFGVDTFEVELAGAQSVMKNLKPADIRGTVNASGLGKGDHNLEITFALETEQCWASASVKVPVTFNGNPQEAGTNTGNTTADGGDVTGNDGAANTEEQTETAGENGAAVTDPTDITEKNTSTQ